MPVHQTFFTLNKSNLFWGFYMTKCIYSMIKLGIYLRIELCGYLLNSPESFSVTKIDKNYEVLWSLRFYHFYTEKPIRLISRYIYYSQLSCILYLTFSGGVLDMGDVDSC